MKFVYKIHRQKSVRSGVAKIPSPPRVPQNWSKLALERVWVFIDESMFFTVLGDKKTHSCWELNATRPAPFGYFNSGSVSIPA